MISFTTFVSMIYFVYAWFAFGVAIISIFSIKELAVLFRGSSAQESTVKGAKSYEM